MREYQFYPTPWRTDEAQHDAPHQDIDVEDANGRRIVTVWIDDACFDANPERQHIAHLFVRAPELERENEKLHALARQMFELMGRIGVVCAGGMPHDGLSANEAARIHVMSIEAREALRQFFRETEGKAQ